MTHVVKCWPGAFQAIADGRKRHEVRVNDREYREGDRILLQEWSRSAAMYTGREIAATIGWVTEDGDPVGIGEHVCVFTLLDVQLGEQPFPTLEKALARMRLPSAAAAGSDRGKL